MSLIAIDVSEQGHESVSEYALCKVSNVRSEGLETVIELVFVPIVEYSVTILTDITKRIT